MITRLKKHNSALFLTLLFVLLAGSSWVFTHKMSDNIASLQNEITKIDNQDLSFIKQTNDILNAKKQIQSDIDSFLQLQSSIAQNKTDDVKQELTQNTKSTEMLSILPPSEIANIQQTESHKKISDEITLLKENSSNLWKSISKMGSSDFSPTQFSLGNISDTSLKSSLSPDISSFLKKEKDIFSALSNYDNSFDNFAVATDNLSQAYPLIKNQENKNKQLINEKISSLNQELSIVEIISILGITALLLLLLFVVFKKKVKPNSLFTSSQRNDFSDFDRPTSMLINPTQHSLNLTLYDHALSLVNELNQLLGKQLNLHFDVDNFESLTQPQQDKLTQVVLELVKYSANYSFSNRENGDIIISLKEVDGHSTFLFKDNGKGLFVEDMKEKIKSQYNVSDAVFINKTDQQIYSFIFKPGFILIPLTDLPIKNLQLNQVSELVKGMNGKISLSTQENHGTEFMINFQSI